MIVCPFHVYHGWVHGERLVSIVLYWYGSWHKLCNVKRMIHFDLRYAYNHYGYLILVYTMIISLRQAFQGLTTNGSFCLPEMLKLREHRCSQDAWIIVGSKWNWVYLCHCGQWYSLIDTWSICVCLQLTFSKDSEISLFYILFYGNYIYHYTDGATTLTDLWHTNIFGNVVHAKWLWLWSTCHCWDCVLSINDIFGRL